LTENFELHREHQNSPLPEENPIETMRNVAKEKDEIDKMEIYSNKKAQIDEEEKM